MYMMSSLEKDVWKIPGCCSVPSDVKLIDIGDCVTNDSCSGPVAADAENKLTIKYCYIKVLVISIL